MKPKSIKKLQHNARDLRVVALDPHTLVVESTSDPLHSHIVKVAFMGDGEVRASCTCEWAQYRGIGCKHTMAALEFLAEQKGRRLSFWRDEADARRQKHRRFRLTAADSRDRMWITSRRAPQAD